MAKASRDKGKVAEREVAGIFNVQGLPCRRAWEDQSKPGGQEDGDLVVGLPDPPYIEVRRRETLSIPAWLREVEEGAGGRRHALIFRRSREPWHAAIPLDHYVTLLKAEQQCRTTFGVGWPD